MHQGAVWKLGQRVNGDSPLNCVALDVAIGFRKFGFGNIQRNPGLLFRPSGNWLRLVLGPVSLREHKPVIAENESSVSSFLFGAVPFRDRALARDWHPQSNGLFAFLDVPALLFPRHE